MEHDTELDPESDTPIPWLYSEVVTATAALLGYESVPRI
jgi:hypothetical protein